MSCHYCLDTCSNSMCAITLKNSLSSLSIIAQLSLSLLLQLCASSCHSRMCFESDCLQVITMSLGKTPNWSVMLLVRCQMDLEKKTTTWYDFLGPLRLLLLLWIRLLVNTYFIRYYEAWFMTNIIEKSITELVDIFCRIWTA